MPLKRRQMTTLYHFACTDNSKPKFVMILVH
jgi:hypothetical protein